VIDQVRGKRTPGIVGAAALLLARSSAVRSRAFFGLVSDELLPRGSGEHFALDLGCGAGFLIRKLQKVGWTVDGLEWNEDAAKRAEESTGARVWSGDFMQADLPKGKYDLIVLNHVFEHFSDPVELLRRLHTLLRPGGRVVLFYPNPDSLGARWFGRDWFPWEVPRHLVLPSPASIKTLTKRAGFRNSRVKTRAYYSSVHWTWSSAYRAGKTPNEYDGGLRISDKLGLAAEHAAAALGLARGWETLAVLEK
jgi:SAM-dependent methyltransferase